MARLPRSHLPDGLYHVTTRCDADRAIYLDDFDRAAFLRRLVLVARRSAWTIHVWCLMTTHYHLVVETARVALSEGMRELNGPYARRFNERHGHRGHLFEERFLAHVIESDRHLEAACLYVLSNPVRAGLCESPEDWPWSGHGLPSYGSGTASGARPVASTEPAKTSAKPSSIPVVSRSSSRNTPTTAATAGFT
jgi:REP element-mobilizing transposase RayT